MNDECNTPLIQQLILGFCLFFNSYIPGFIGLILFYSVEKYWVRQISDEKFNPTVVLIDDIKASANWWFRVDHKCLAQLAAYHQIG